MTMAVQVTAPDGTVLGVADGSVDMDSRRTTQRTCSLTLTPTSSLSLSAVYDLVMQPGFEATVKRGLYVNGGIEYVPLGVFATDTATKPAQPTGQLQWSGSDRSKKISRARFTDSYQATKGTALASAIGDLLTSRWPLVAYDFSNVSDTLTAGVKLDPGESSDPWQRARDIMADHGYDLAFNGIGIVEATPLLDPAVQEVAFDFGAGTTNLVTGGETQGSLEDTYNRVIASGEGSDVTAPVQAVVWDNDPSSPTYYLGSFGARPYFLSSPLLTTVDMCTRAATTRLAKIKGRAEQFQWPAVVHPALEPLDLVTVTLAGKTQRLVIDRLTIPLGPSEVMAAVARQIGGAA